MVYVISSTDFLKIGRAKNPKQRLYSLQGASPVKLKILYTYDLPGKYEKLLHWKFSEFRAHGEWFRKDDRILSVLASLSPSTADEILSISEMPRRRISLSPRRIGIPVTPEAKEKNRLKCNKWRSKNREKYNAGIRRWRAKKGRK